MLRGLLAPQGYQVCNVLGSESYLGTFQFGVVHQWSTSGPPVVHQWSTLFSASNAAQGGQIDSQAFSGPPLAWLGPGRREPERREGSEDPPDLPAAHKAIS